MERQIENRLQPVRGAQMQPGLATSVLLRVKERTRVKKWNLADRARRDIFLARAHKQAGRLRHRRAAMPDRHRSSPQKRLREQTGTQTTASGAGGDVLILVPRRTRPGSAWA